MHISKNVSMQSCHIFKNGPFILDFLDQICPKWILLGRLHNQNYHDESSKLRRTKNLVFSFYAFCFKWFFYSLRAQLYFMSAFKIVLYIALSSHNFFLDWFKIIYFWPWPIVNIIKLLKRYVLKSYPVFWPKKISITRQMLLCT